MTLIDEIRADRRHSSRNPNVDNWKVVSDGPIPGWVEVRGPAFKIGAATTATDLNGQDYTDRHKDARRIARVPVLEDAYEKLLARAAKLESIALDYRYVLHSAKAGRDLHCGLYVAKEYHFTRNQIDAALGKIGEALATGGQSDD